MSIYRSIGNANASPAPAQSFAYTSDFIICFQFSLRGIFKAAANGLQGAQPRHFYGILICGLNYSTPPPPLARPKHLRHQPYLPSLLRGMMIPTRLFLPQHIGHLDKATEMQCLAIGRGDTLAQHTGITDARRLVGHILQQTQLIGSAGIHLLIPATIGIGHAAEAAVVASGAHGQIDLLHLMIGGQVQRGSLLAQCQLAYGFVAWRCLKDVH